MKEGFTCNELSDITCLDENVEMATARLKLPFTHDIYVINIYCPPAGDIDCFIDILQQCVTTIHDNRNCDVFI